VGDHHQGGVVVGVIVGVSVAVGEGEKDEFGVEGS
jgi:hypothetical protein